MFILKSANNVDNDIFVTFRKTLLEVQSEMLMAVESTASDNSPKRIDLSIKALLSMMKKVMIITFGKSKKYRTILSKNYYREEKYYVY